MARFLYDGDPRSAFLLRGYAGTGKTSLISALIQTLPALRVSSLLLAPTGRAAKVISSYSDRPAFTIHKKIYMTVTDASGAVRTVRGINKHSYTLFIVDEASMIGLEPTSTRQSLLEDLIDYVYDGNHCRLMLIGDSAQLPPVGQSESPALDERYLAAAFSLNIISAELTEVVRQKQLSGILAGATALRSQITALVGGDEASLPLFSPNGVDVIRLAGEDLMETLYREYGDFALDQVVVICRSNKRANLFNQGVRNTVLFREEEVNAGDYLMVVKNNYYWLDEESSIGFIANGDIVEVLSATCRNSMAFVLPMPLCALSTIPTRNPATASSSSRRSIPSRPRLLSTSPTCSSTTLWKTMPTFPPRPSACASFVPTPITTPSRSSSPMPSPATRPRVDNGAPSLSTKAFCPPTCSSTANTYAGSTPLSREPPTGSICSISSPVSMNK